MAKTRLAILIEFDTKDDWRNIRRLLKSMLRTYGMRCLAVRPPEETTTFLNATITNGDDHASIKN
jgi:hypothetical protein